MEFSLYQADAVVSALPMTFGDYCVYKGSKYPSNVKATKEGYLTDIPFVENNEDSTHVTWFPKAVFESMFTTVNPTNLEYQLRTIEHAQAAIKGKSSPFTNFYKEHPEGFIRYYNSMVQATASLAAGMDIELEPMEIFPISEVSQDFIDAISHALLIHTTYCVETSKWVSKATLLGAHISTYAHNSAKHTKAEAEEIARNKALSSIKFAERYARIVRYI